MHTNDAYIFYNIHIYISQALVTELTPDQRVMNAMNEINSSKRLKEYVYMSLCLYVSMSVCQYVCMYVFMSMYVFLLH
jgi:hypothetical protein